MELGLTLGGDQTTSKPFIYSNHHPNNNNNNNKSSSSSSANLGLGFYMALGLNNNNNNPNEKIESRKTSESKENEDDDDDRTSSEHTRDDEHITPLQLDLLPLAPVPRPVSSRAHTQHLRFSSDNGSSGSSGNLGMPALARGFDVNRLAAEEVSSPNSVASSFQMDFSIFRSGGGNPGNVGNSKRDLGGAAGNDTVEAERASSRASDDDENGLNARKKLRLSKEQSAYLEESFKEHNTLNPKQKLALAKQLNLRPRQVEVWFQNRRARTKLKQTEVDCEYLKRCCETLTEENRRLHKELQELRTLKTSNPFYMQLPATTLTMCPSCERVATTSTPPPSSINPTTAVAATTTTTTTTTTESTPKAIPFPISRPKFNPFVQTTNHPHQSATS
ncbi:hypothetical protein ACH5RR_000658 [Cinchona calisaya]|uniref:Homeobox domain-containing protein n=1 Tax=Cinchona calisaya TaxID=153742 RepID=A0ABD3B175_9GENT